MLLVLDLKIAAAQISTLGTLNVAERIFCRTAKTHLSLTISRDYACEIGMLLAGPCLYTLKLLKPLGTLQNTRQARPRLPDRLLVQHDPNVKYCQRSHLV